MIDNPASSSTHLANAAWFEQLASLSIQRLPPSGRRATLTQLDRQAAATVRADLAAGAALEHLVTAHFALPHWKIVQPPPPGTLLGDLKGAQNRFTVPWEYLAIFGAARYLHAHGGPRDMAGALYHYNPSSDYVSAVTDFANRMRADPRAFYGYYYPQVIYDKDGGPVLLPVGYPRSRPVPLQ